MACSLFPRVGSLRRVSFLAGAFIAVLAVMRADTGYVTGSNSWGQLVVASVGTNPSGEVTLATGVVTAAVGSEHTLWVKADGTLWALGGNADGQLGVGDTVGRDTAVQIASDVAAVAAGRAHTLVLKTDGTLWATGDNTYGQLGLGDTADRLSPVQLASDVASVSAGDDHTLFVKTDGSLWTCGRNSNGQLGDETTTDRSTPVQIATGVTSATGGALHTFFIKTNATLWACGQGTYGQLGTGVSNVTSQATPVQVATGVAKAAAGAAHSLLVKADGTLWGAGDGLLGQFGNNVSIQRSSFSQIGTGYSSVAVGSLHSLFIKSTGALSGSGDNQLRQLGGTLASAVYAAQALSSNVSAAWSREFHSVYLKTDGTLVGRGDNRAGQLGATVSSAATAISVGDDIAAIAQGAGHTLLLKTDGTLWASGDNTYGQLGAGDTTPRTAPVQVATAVASVSAGSFHTLFVKTNGTLWAMGRNNRGQLCDATTTNRTSAVQVATGVLAASAGGAHSLYLTEKGALMGAGDNDYRQINSNSSPILTPAQVAAGVTAFSAGGAHSLFVTGGTLYATGNNDWGQLGTGTTFNIPTTSQPYAIATGVNVVSTAYDHTLFLKSDGTLWGMGRNNAGELGLGDTAQRLSPVQISSAIAAIAAGGLSGGRGAGHSIFAKTDGTLWAAGDNRFGQLGDGTRINRLSPVQIAAQHVVAVSAGDLNGAFVRRPPVTPAITTQPASQEIEYGYYARLRVGAPGGFLSYQWFRGASGDTSHPVVGATSATLLTPPVAATQSFWVRVTNELGSIDSAAATVAPLARPTAMVSGAGALGYGAFGESLSSARVGVPIPLAADIASLAHSSSHTLILKRDGTLWGVGQNNSGQLGLGDTTDRASPVQIASGVVAAAAGTSHSLFLKADGTLWAMGANTSGQLGDGTTTTRSSPVQIATSVQAMAAGSSHTIFLKTDGTLWATGSNSSGQLGNGTTTSLSMPAQIATDVAALAAGSAHSLFIKTDRTLWAMGSNSAGQLGDGTTTSRLIAVLISNDVSAVSAHANGAHTLFLKTDGALFGMGGNISGRLGLGDTTNRTAPALIDTGVTACSAGANHSLWVKADASLWAAGANDFGQLGLGVAPAQLLPCEIAAGVTRAVATAYSSWFVAADGSLRGMGRNHAGQLGAPAESATSFVGLLSSVSGIDAMFSGQPESRLLGSDGGLWSSRGNPSDGDSTPGVAATDVVRIVGMPLFKAAGLTVEFASGPERLLWLRADGTLWGAGDNSTGALGTGDTVSRSDPVQIASDVADAVSSGYGTTILKTDGTLWTMGLMRSSSGGGQYSFGYLPVRMDTDVQAIAASWSHVLYLKTDGSLWGFGDGGYRQLSMAVPIDTMVSAPLRIATDVARFAAGQRHTLLVRTNGTLWACGYFLFGQLGVSGSGQGLGLTQVTTGVADVVTTAETSFIIKTDGSVWSAGQNTFGQLGLGSTTSFTTFTRLQAGSPGQYLSGVSRIIPAISGDNTFFLKTDGSLWGTGRNDRGQLGLGHTDAVKRVVLVRAQAYDVSASGVHTLVLHDPTNIAAPSVVAQPVSQSVGFGDFATMTVGASGGGLLTYQWYEGAVGDTARPVVGATDATLRLSAFAGTASYWARVRNGSGSADSAAATITVVGAGSSDFRAWAEARGLKGSRLSIASDGDGDGVVNLLEYVFATAPEAAGDHSTFAPDLVHLPEGEFLVLTHRRRKDAGAAVSYESSADLQAWAPVSLAPVVIVPDADGDGLVEEVSVALPLDAGEPRRFLRVKVSSP